MYGMPLAGLSGVKSAAIRLHDARQVFRLLGFKVEEGVVIHVQRVFNTRDKILVSLYSPFPRDAAWAIATLFVFFFDG